MLGKKRLCCENCRKSKIKCNHGKPQCDQCVKRGRICVYLYDVLPAPTPYSDIHQYLTMIKIQHRIPISKESSLEQIFLSSKSNRYWIFVYIKGYIFHSDPTFGWIRNGRITESVKLINTAARHRLYIIISLYNFEFIVSF